MRCAAIIATALLVLAALPAVAQIRGIPPSVTSIGGSHSPGIPASVTSINNHPRCCVTALFPDTVFGFGNAGFGHHRRFRFNTVFGTSGFQPIFVEVPVMVPVQVPVVMAPIADPSMNATAQVVDDPPRRVVRRRASDDDDPDDGYVESRDRYADSRHDRYADSRDRRPPPSQAASQPAAPAVEAKPLPATVLVFRDGHRTEVRDYAIAGETFYDLTNGLTKKIRLADLDLDATAKVNDERGVSFSPPKHGS